MIITRTVAVNRPAATVFPFVSDFTTTTDWDPATVRTIRVSGDGGLGTIYRNTSRFLGRVTELTYVVVDWAPHTRVSLRGENATVVAVDTMTLRELGPDRVELTYQATFSFQGRWRWLGTLARPLLALAFRRLGDRAEAGLRAALNALPAR